MAKSITGRSHIPLRCNTRCRQEMRAGERSGGEALGGWEGDAPSEGGFSLQVSVRVCPAVHAKERGLCDSPPTPTPRGCWPVWGSRVRAQPGSRCRDGSGRGGHRKPGCRPLGWTCTSDRTSGVAAFTGLRAELKGAAGPPREALGCCRRAERGGTGLGKGSPSLLCTRLLGRHRACECPHAWPPGSLQRPRGRARVTRGPAGTRVTVSFSRNDWLAPGLGAARAAQPSPDPGQPASVQGRGSDEPTARPGGCSAEEPRGRNR